MRSDWQGRHPPLPHKGQNRQVAAVGPPQSRDDSEETAGTVVSPQSENVLFCKVEMSYSRIVTRLLFPSGCMVLHRGQPSRLPFGALNCGLDGHQAAMRERTVMRGMARLFWRDFCELATPSTLWESGHFYFAPTPVFFILALAGHRDYHRCLRIPH